MSNQRLHASICILTILISLAGCNFPASNTLPDIPGLTFKGETTPIPAESIAPPLPSPPETLVTFRARAPSGTPVDEPVYLTLLDEVTGLAMNTQPIPMPHEESESESDSLTFSITLPFPIGSVIKYRYERGAGAVRVAEHLSDGSAVRYRLYHVSGQGAVEDVISRWTDTTYSLPVGRIQGVATDQESGRPIPGLLIAAGGAQTISASDGFFMLEGLPPGVHNLVGYALDGAYQTFQQGALVSDGSTTPTPIQLKAASFTNVVFVVKPPGGTLPIVPLRLAGNLTQLGNSFADLSGGVSSLAANMPVLSALPDGRYTITVALPVGADIRYKYTLGDGFWNAERTPEGAPRLRQLIVPDQTVLIEEEIVSWFGGSTGAVTFDLTAPADTPAGDFISIQFNPLFGWTEPIPMWKLGENRWAYVLYSPLNLPGNFTYRYCRNGQCGFADDAQTPGLNGAGRPLTLTGEPQTLTDVVSAWSDWSGSADVLLPPVENVQGLGDGFWTAVELATGYHPSWDHLMKPAFELIRATGANRLVLTPTWSYGRKAPGNELPILAPQRGRDPAWNELVETAEQAQSLGLTVIIRPVPNFLVPGDEWWNTALRDESWWQVWFEQYRVFALNHADLAARTDAQALILGGAWMRPALPGTSLPDGNPTQLPANAETRWRDLLTEVRTHFNGQLAWAVTPQDVIQPPAFLDQVDLIYLELPEAQGAGFEPVLGAGLESWLDNTLAVFQALEGKPMALAASCPSNPDLQAQVDCYQALLTAVNARSWISGFVSTGFYPPAALRDDSPSIHGKPAETLLGSWYPEMTK